MLKQQKMKELSRVLNKRIAIQKFSIMQDDEGFDVEQWVTYKTICASINNLWGKEFYAAKAINAENAIEFVCRYSKDLSNIDTKKYRIFWDNRAFNITFIDNIKYENRWLKMKGIEVK